jgi:hypothetical protein
MTTKMFLLIIISFGFFLPTVATAQRAEKAATEEMVIDEKAGTAQITSSVSAKKIQTRDQLVFDPAMVPQGKTYYLMKNGKVDKKFKSGSSTPMVADCAQIKCPESFDKDIVCWKCVER